ncbi:ABC transporter ATP-binding protein [Pararhodobacter sp.]|uniref:ABC transporter ATP-binding protein n=1 Tax=Pararhodobacter sp. TaxID=2127056 RepID=UPI002FDDDEDD
MTGDAFIEIDGVSKNFGSFPAVRDVSLTIARGECFALLGASGCGKTTLLRMLAGFESTSAGSIRIDGLDMAGVPPWNRPVHMMFQSYALFPHMSVARNVGYGLQHERMSRAQRSARVAEMLDLVQMTGFEDRKPHQISGGQRQRIALARALARQPKVLLLDEPLAALDKKLREQTQFELMSIQARTGVTFVVVTHDQEEAMTLADRLAVMDKGAVRQVGRPGEVYENPNSRYVAGFLGTISQFDGRAGRSVNGILTLDVPDFGRSVQVACPLDTRPGEALTLALRPEKLRLTRERPEGPNVIPGTVRDLAYFGKDSLYRINLPSGALISVHAVNARRGAQTPDWDDSVWVSFDPDAAILLKD